VLNVDLSKSGYRRPGGGRVGDEEREWLRDAWLVSVPGFGVKERDGEGDLTIATGGVEDLYECEMMVSLRLTRPGRNTMISAI
jgi:hypothetical protein